MPRSLFLLALCNAYMYVSSSLLITISALIGYTLAEDKLFATLPTALQFLAVMCTTIPASLLMEKIGRKPAFILSSLLGISGAALALWSISVGSFPGYCGASFLFGTFTAFGNYYRFTAAEIVPAERRGQAISFVMLGGLVAALIGPNLAHWSNDLIAGTEFAGAFAVLIGVYVLSMLTISFADLPAPVKHQNLQPGRPILEIARQPTFIVAVLCAMLGYATMNLVMTSTPLAMNATRHGISDISIVIQWHVIAMFLPSFFTGHLIRHLGILAVLSAGVVFGIVCTTISLLGDSVIHFTLALVALGLCWNFLYIGGTTLLTETYTEAEKSRAQAANDFLVFTTVTITALSAGAVHFQFGWRVVNLSVLPFLAIIAVAIVVLAGQRRRAAGAVVSH